MTSITQWCRKSQWTIVGVAGVGAFFIFLFLDGVHLQFVVPVRRVCGDNELALSLWMPADDVAMKMNNDACYQHAVISGGNDEQSFGSCSGCKWVCFVEAKHHFTLIYIFWIEYDALYFVFEGLFVFGFFAVWYRLPWVWNKESNGRKELNLHCGQHVGFVISTSASQSRRSRFQFWLPSASPKTRKLGSVKTLNW